MIAAIRNLRSRRAFLAGGGALAALSLAGCATGPRISLTEAIRRLLMLAADNAFARLTAPGGFWDRQVTRLDLPEVFDGRGAVLQQILTSVLFKDRLQHALNTIAEEGARRAAPVVADTIRMIGYDNALALVQGGPHAASDYLRANMGPRLIDVMVPALGDGLRLAEDPLVGQAIAALTGVDVNGVARSLAREVDDAIWGEIGRQEAEIRANPEATHDPLLIAVFKAV
ncbi:DUF4197 domain-containing protein [Novosphingobium sp.]|uniref:DUF4197 domain-containing protein n=1 Tax=Novosphingobium sp. TaxID=1874826 RepID=UPI0035B1D78F